MNKKLLQKVKQLSKTVGQSMLKGGKSISSQYNIKARQLKQQDWNQISSKVSQSARGKLASLKEYLGSPNWSYLMAKQQNHNSKDTEHQSSSSGKSPTHKQPSSVQEQPTKEHPDYSKYLKSKMEWLKKTADQKYEEAAGKLSSEKVEQLRREGAERLSEASKKLKETGTWGWQALNQHKDSFIKNAQEKIQQNEQSFKLWKSSLEKTKGNTIKTLRDKLAATEEYIANQKEMLSKLGQQSSGKLSQNSQYLKDTLTKRISEAASAKAQLMTKLISKLFWRVALLLGLVAFAYGAGTALPREVREHLRFLRKKASLASGEEGQERNGKDQ